MSVLLVTAPMTPLIFMGQEWSATTPFQFFTDLEPGLGRMVTDGRRNEFRDFPEFSAPDARGRIPDPQAARTFETSRLRWDERDLDGHAHVLALYRELLALRGREPALQASRAMLQDAEALADDTIVVRRADNDVVFGIVVRLRGMGQVDVRLDGSTFDPDAEVLLTTELPRFVSDPRPIDVSTTAGQYRIRFARPGAIILKSQTSRRACP